MSFFLFALFACSPATSGANDSDDTDLVDTDDSDVDAVLTPVYVTFYSHNEDSWGGQVNQPDAYNKYRADLVERIELITDRGATLNWQTDATVTAAMIKHEKPGLFGTTNDVNILVYMNELGVSIDPHTHKGNFADIVFDVEHLGATASGVVGGVKAFECTTDPSAPLALTDWYTEMGLAADGLVHGVEHATTWKPEILSGPAMGGHWFDDMSTGVWRPGNADDFYTHDDANQMIYVGQGDPHDQTNLGPEHASGSGVEYSDAGYIHELVAKLAAGELPAEKLYTASVHLRDTETLTDGGSSLDVNAGAEAILDSLQPYVDSGQVVYLTYQDVAAMWSSDFASEPYWVEVEEFSAYQTMWDDMADYCAVP
jgi:hypothetical protein